jgi:predicted O-methyltransferase YrrM
MLMNFQKFYDLAKKHKDEHVEDGRKCGGEPYKSFDRLFEIVKNFSSKLENEIKVLEIGTAVGFTTFVLQSAGGLVDTVEHHQLHVDIAKENIKNWGGDVSKINFYVGEAMDVLTKLNNFKYDVIFFDGYGVKENFYNEFERLLASGGLLIVANRHLKSTDQNFFTHLQDKNMWEFADEFADTVVYKKL